MSERVVVHCATFTIIKKLLWYSKNTDKFMSRLNFILINFKHSLIWDIFRSIILHQFTQNVANYSSLTYLNWIGFPILLFSCSCISLSGLRIKQRWSKCFIISPIIAKYRQFWWPFITWKIVIPWTDMLGVSLSGNLGVIVLKTVPNVEIQHKWFPK